jgi:hypothetical protein
VNYLFPGKQIFMEYRYKITTLWNVSSLLIVMSLSHSAIAQQLPDSLLAVNEPMMLLADSVEPVELTAVASGTISNGIWWPVVYWGENPLVTSTYTVTVTCWPGIGSNQVVTVDTLLALHADSFLGAKASIVVPKKISNAAEASDFAGNIHRFTKNKEEE